MKKIAIIPARGGSKRLPRKNIIPLSGKPLLQRVVETCLSSGVFDLVIVSTEDEEIKTVAHAAGAEVHNRSHDIARDRSTVVEVCESVLDEYQCDDFCCIYATAALLTSRTLQESAERFELDSSITSLMGVSEYNYSPLQALEVDDAGHAKMLLPEYMKVQSQFHPKTRVSNGTIYWARKDSFLQERTFYSSKLGVFDIPESESCDLDTKEDYEILQRKFDALMT